MTGLLAAEDASVFSQAARDTIVKLTSPATVYGHMTQEFDFFLKKTFGSELAGSGSRV